MAVAPRKPTTRFDDVVDYLGTRICSGRLQPGDVVATEHVEAATAVSRSVVREAVRVLAALGLLESRRRVGAVVLPRTSWNLFSPRVIRWCLDSGMHPGLVGSLLDVRHAIEPHAAALAAEHAQPDTVVALVEAAGSLWGCAAAHDVDGFLAADARFHGLLLEGSGNALFRQLAGFIAEALRGQTRQQLQTAELEQGHVQLHVDLARAIQQHDTVAAESLARQIVADARSSLPSHSL